MGRTLTDFGLTEQRYHLLLVVAAGGLDGTVQGALARELHCPESRISLLVRELADAGMIQAVRDDSDRRHVMVRLLSHGESVLDQAISVQRDALHSLIANLEVTEVTRLAELVARTYLGLDLSVTVRRPRPKAAPSDPAARARLEPTRKASTRAKISQMPTRGAAATLRARDTG
jgi:DNA-binding MarR family transcriptional regulator